jgi:hypothetical protein
MLLYHLLCASAVIGWVSCTSSQAISRENPLVCKNPTGVGFNKSPEFAAHESTRAVGILIRADKGAGESIPDRRSQCLPLPLRLNNPGAQKSVGAAGQLGRDKKGHAVFDTVESGIAEVVAWVERRRVEQNDTAFLMMARYAPPDDCIGSMEKIRDEATGNLVCPPGFPLNPTREYAVKIAAAVGKGPDEHMNLGKTKCPNERQAIAALVSAIITFEAGSGFCDHLCVVETAVIAKAINRVWGEIPLVCSGP